MYLCFRFSKFHNHSTVHIAIISGANFSFDSVIRLSFIGRIECILIVNCWRTDTKRQRYVLKVIQESALLSGNTLKRCWRACFLKVETNSSTYAASYSKWIPNRPTPLIPHRKTIALCPIATANRSMLSCRYYVIWGAKERTPYEKGFLTPPSCIGRL